MDIKFVHSEVNFFEKLDNKELNVESIKSHIQTDLFLYSLENIDLKMIMEL